MFETTEYQFDAVLARMLARVPPELDRREGSVIYDALAVAAAELAEMYAKNDMALQAGYMQTATGEYVDARLEEKGLTRIPAAPAQRTVISNITLPLGTRLMVNSVFFVVTTSNGTTSIATAEQPGEIGNVAGGNATLLEPVVPGLTSIVVADELYVPGTEEESDENAKERYFTEVRKPGTSGNKADYEAWAREVPGVGGVQVVPLEYGRNTVGMYLIDANKRPVTTAVASRVKDYIDPNPGMGEGEAPIGAILTVKPAAAVSINVNATLTLGQGYTLQDVYTLFNPAFEVYLKNLAFTDPFVRLTGVSAILLGIPPIVDFTGLQLNGVAGNIQMLKGQVAVPGGVVFNVSTG